MGGRGGGVVVEHGVKLSFLKLSFLSNKKFISIN